MGPTCPLSSMVVVGPETETHDPQNNPCATLFIPLCADTSVVHIRQSFLLGYEKSFEG